MIDLLVVGAGPAGLNAAITAAKNGLHVKIVDEFPQVGGRLLGQLHQEPSGEWWNGVELGAELHQKAIESGVTIECEVSVYDIDHFEETWIVYTSTGEIVAKNLLLATGASETPIPIPGWTLPGVMSIGAAQVMGNVHRVKPGNTCVIIGANVLSMAIANELRLCGIQVKEIVLPEMGMLSGEAGKPSKVLASLMKLTHLAPTRFLRQVGKLGRFVNPNLAIKYLPKKGVKLFDIPIKLKTAAIEIVGDREAEGVRTVSVTADGTRIEGTEKVVEADFVCIAGGLSPMAELASIVGCKFKYAKELGGHVPIHSERMETNIPNLYVAGNITGVESAKVAIAQGKVAGLSIVSAIQALDKEIDQALKQAIEEVIITRKEALIQFQTGISEMREEIYHSFEMEKQQIEEIASAL